MTRRVLRVGIDGRAFASPAAGVRRYVSELTREMAARLAGSVGESASDSYSDSDSRSANAEIELIAIGAPAEAALPSGVQRASEGPSAPTNFGRHLTGLPLAMPRARLDLFHAPAYTAPLWGSTPVVLSIHDVSYARHPEWYPYRRDPLRRWFYRQSARRAALILTISEFSKREIVAAYDIPPDRIIVTPLGVSEMFHPAQPVQPAQTTERAAGAPPFLLHVGDLHARRNLGIVVKALARLRGQGSSLTSGWAHNPKVAGSNPAPATVVSGGGGAVVRLVLAGVDRGVADALLDEAVKLGVREAIDIRGRVSDEELVTLYQRCAALVYPSRYEGFGFPLAEAMACGAPVIASNASAIPEVTGSAAVLLDPDDEQGFADAIARVLSDAEHVASLRARGLARAAQLTWAETAARTMEAYRRVASGAGGFR
jgi:glycosyltransferase involved in cell wall biosynthesis